MDLTVSYHPITTQQMREWYFNVFEDLGAANDLKVRIPKEQLKDNNLEELEAFYTNKYLDMVKRSRELDYDNFNQWHGYFLAIVQGFFEKFYFVQGAALSSVVDKEFAQNYFTPWREVIEPEYIEDLAVSSKLNGAFSAGAYISPEQVKKLLNDYENDPYIKELLEEQFVGKKVEVLIEALKYASQNNQGLIESTSIITPGEELFEEPECYSNLFNCDVISAAVFTTDLAEHYDKIYKGLGDDR